MVDRQILWFIMASALSDSKSQCFEELHRGSFVIGLAHFPFSSEGCLLLRNVKNNFCRR
jgi:hypothetical protein